MFLFPITGQSLNRWTGVDPIEGESFQLIFRLLVGLNETLHVGFYCDPLRLCSGTQFGFKLGMDGKLICNLLQVHRIKAAMLLA